MRISNRLLASIAVVSLVATLSGCSTSRATAIGNEQPKPTQQLIKTYKKPDNGKIASITQVTKYNPILGPNLKMYKIFYWSHGLKVEALLTEPARHGQYPLLVSLHGGSLTPTNAKAVSSYTYTERNVVQAANDSMVMLYPEYEGYMQSQGTVHGLKNDTKDVLNAIAAAESLHEVKPQDTYIMGGSLGGGIALMTAEYDHDVRAVVAVSPFVGLNDFVSWANQHAKPGSMSLTQLQFINGSYGDKVDSSVFNERSPDVKKISAPVLLLQGTADHHVPWQTVRMFAQQMNNAKKTVKLILYPGGRHGLLNTYKTPSTLQIQDWFSKYGLNVTIWI